MTEGTGRIGKAPSNMPRPEAEKDPPAPVPAEAGSKFSNLLKGEGHADERIGAGQDAATASDGPAPADLPFDPFRRPPRARHPGPAGETGSELRSTPAPAPGPGQGPGDMDPGARHPAPVPPGSLHPHTPRAGGTGPHPPGRPGAERSRTPSCADAAPQTPPPPDQAGAHPRRARRSGWSEPGREADAAHPKGAAPKSFERDRTPAETEATPTEVAEAAGQAAGAPLPLHASGSGTEAAGAARNADLDHLVSELVERLHVSVPDSGIGAVRIQLADHVLGGATVVIRRDDTSLVVEFTGLSEHDAVRLDAIRDPLRQTLAERTGLTVDVPPGQSGQQPGDGRSRNRHIYGPEDDADGGDA